MVRNELKLRVQSTEGHDTYCHLHCWLLWINACPSGYKCVPFYYDANPRL